MEIGGVDKNEKARLSPYYDGRPSVLCHWNMEYVHIGVPYGHEFIHHQHRIE